MAQDNKVALNRKPHKGPHAKSPAKDNEQANRKNDEEGSDTESDTELLRRLSHKQVEQYGTLAEQLICLRGDLDKSRFDMLRIQRQHSTSLDTIQPYSPYFSLKPLEADCVSDDPPKPRTLAPRLSDQTAERPPALLPIQDRRRWAEWSHTSLQDQPVVHPPRPKLLPPRAPLVAHYNSNSKNLSRVERTAAPNHNVSI